MAIDTKAILARASEVLVGEVLSACERDLKNRIDLAEDRAAQAEAQVATLTTKLSNVHANLINAEEDRDDALTWVERCADQTRRAEKAEARLAVAVEALRILGTDTNPQTGSLARAALAKVGKA